MTWDDQVAQGAQAWANMCVTSHDQNNPLGENIAWGGAEMPTERWYAEVSNYFPRPGNGMVTGHFTQVVWRDSTALGCGRADCGNLGIMYVCRYSPAGNFAGQYEANVFPAGGPCPP
jgi:hypothetical protein